MASPHQGTLPVTKYRRFDEQGTPRADGIRMTRTTGTSRVPRRMASRALSSFIAGFKAAVTSRAGGESIPETSGNAIIYEHIIRNEAEFEKIWNYIDSNPLQ